MTKFLAYYHLRPIHDTKDFVGISEDSDPANIIATIGRNVISITNIASQKEIQSWTVLDKLSTKVVYDKASEKYVAVFGNLYLRCWSNDTTDLNKIKKLKCKKQILDLITSENDELLVLFANGSCEPLSSAIENRKLSNDAEADLQMNMEITQSKLFSIPNSTNKLLTYFLKKDQNMELITILLDEDLKQLGDHITYKLSRHDKNLKLVGYTIVENQFWPCLMTIWSDKRIFMLPLDDKSSPNDSPGNFISMLDVLNTTLPLSIIGLSKHCVVIYGSDTNQEGGSLILFNTQYKVVKAQQFFKIYFNFSKLWVVNNYILLAMGQNLSVVSFNICQELLCDMIGSQFSNQNQCVAVDQLINEANEEYLEDDIKFVANDQKLRKSLAQKYANEEYNITADLADGNIIPFESFEKFNEKYISLCSQNMLVEAFSSKENCDEMFVINLMSNCNADSFSHGELETIANHLKQYGASEQEISEKLITLAIKANLIEDIAICLRRYSSINESILVNVLKFSLQGTLLEDIKKINEIDVTFVENGYSEGQKDFPCPKDDFPNVDLNLKIPKLISVSKPFDLLNIVLSCSFDTDTIARYIRSDIELDEALVFMQHLYNIFKSKEICLEERPETSINFDNDLKILQWFGIILSTHFQKISLARDSDLVDLLSKWNDSLLELKKDLIELQDLSASLYNLVDRKNIIHGNKYSKWYSVESVKLF